MNKYFINQVIIDEIINTNNDYSSKVNSFIDNIFSYAAFIMKEQNMIALAKVEAYDTQDYQDRIKKIDNSRKIKHDAAIAALSVLNRMADNLNLEKVYNGPIDYNNETRGDIAHCIIEYAKENLDKDKYGVAYGIERF